MYPSVGVFLYYGLEDDVLFNCKSVVYMILQLRFGKNIKIFYCVHWSSFVCEVYGVHNVVHGADSVSVFQEVLGKSGFAISVFEITRVLGSGC